MVCQNCGGEFRDGAICPFCGSDVKLMQMARSASLRQYNLGVSAAREGDYSAAIEALNRCIAFDKRNVVARNLLGIAYYLVGMPGNALEQWIISSSLQTENNPAAGYISSLQKNARTLEKQDDAVVMYNHALDLFANGSEDLAVIQLKKALDYSPNFVMGHNLLAAYYLSKKERYKARQEIHKALRVDKGNQMALEYLAMLTPKGSEKSRRGSKTGYDETARSRTSLSRIIRPELLTFFLGAAAAAVLVFFLVLPSMQETAENEITQLQKQVADLTEENENGTSRFALQYQQLEQENDTLRQENEKYRQQEQNRQQENSFQLAQAYAVGGQSVEAAELLIQLDTSLFTQEEQTAIADLKSQTYPAAAQQYYQTGSEQFFAGDVDEAQTNLEQALAFATEGDTILQTEYMDELLYDLGQIMEQKGDPFCFCISNLRKGLEEGFNTAFFQQRGKREYGKKEPP